MGFYKVYKALGAETQLQNQYEEDTDTYSYFI